MRYGAPAGFHHRSTSCVFLYQKLTREVMRSLRRSSLGLLGFELLGAEQLSILFFVFLSDQKYENWDSACSIGTWSGSTRTAEWKKSKSSAVRPCKQSNQDLCHVFLLRIDRKTMIFVGMQIDLLTLLDQNFVLTYKHSIGPSIQPLLLMPLTY